MPESTESLSIFKNLIFKFSEKCILFQCTNCAYAFYCSLFLKFLYFFCQSALHSNHWFYTARIKLYSLLIEKDVCGRQNVSVKLSCVCVCLSSGDFLIFFSVRVSSFFSYCCAICTSVLSFPRRLLYSL